MKLFTAEDGTIHAIDIDSVRPMLTLNYHRRSFDATGFNYHHRSFDATRYVSYQFYKHPVYSHMYLKMVVSRLAGEYKQTLRSVITIDELRDFTSNHIFNIFDSDIQNLIEEGVIIQHRFGQAKRGR